MHAAGWDNSLHTASQVQYLVAEEHIANRRFEAGWRALDVQHMDRFKNLEVDPTFMETSLQRLSYELFRQGGEHAKGQDTTALKDTLKAALGMLRKPDEVEDDSTLEAEETVQQLDEAEPIADDFDTFDLSQRSDEDDDDDVGTSQSAALVAQDVKPLHEVVPSPFRKNLLHFYVLATYDKASRERVEGALAFAASDDPLLARTATSTHFLALLDEVKGWLAKQTMLHQFQDMIGQVKQSYDQEVKQIQTLTLLLDKAVKDGHSIRSMNQLEAFDQWWTGSWQAGELASKALDLLNDIDAMRGKVRFTSAGLALSVKTVKDNVSELLNMAFAICSDLWWLTIRLINDVVQKLDSEGQTQRELEEEEPVIEVEAEPESPEEKPLEAEPQSTHLVFFLQYARKFEEMAEVLEALRDAPLKAPKCWEGVLAAVPLQKSWLACATELITVALAPKPEHVSSTYLAHLKAVCKASEPVEQSPEWEMLMKGKVKLMALVVRPCNLLPPDLFSFCSC